MKSFLIADDHVTVRLGLEFLVKELFNDNCSVRHASSGHGVLTHLQQVSYDVLIMDLNMPEPAGLPLLQKALSLQSHLKVLVNSVYPDNVYAPQAIGLGALGFINKNADDQELKRAIQTITRGDTWLHESLRGDNHEEAAADNHTVFNQLSARELQVTHLLLKGNGVLEVSNILGISASATSTLKGRVFRKLSINSLVDLYQLGRQHQLFTDDSMRH